MGASGSQQPPHIADLRLEYPQATSSKAFFAHVHTEANGSSKYRTWGHAQAVSLFADDIITVTVGTAESEDDFDRLQSEDYAEVHIPWSIVAGQMVDGVEVVFALGLATSAPRLGHDAPLSHYVDAFYRAYSLAEEDPTAPQLQWPPLDPGAPVVVGTSNVVASGVRELGPEEMRRLFQLQVQNQELRAWLRLDEGATPEVEELVEEHVGRLRQAVSRNFGLRAEQQAVDQELAVATSCLTQEQRLIVTDDAVSPAITPPGSGDLLDQEEYERRHSAVMTEIQTLTRDNINLISAYDGQVELLEAELLEAQRRPRQSGGAPGGTGADDGELPEEVHAQLEEASRRLQRQAEDLRLLEQEIERLLQALDEERRRAQEVADVDNPRVLQMQEEVLQAKQSLAQDQALVEEQRSVLHRDLRALEDELQLTATAKLEAEREIGEFRQSQEAAACVERERTDEQLASESLDKELSRTKCRVGFCDEKIERLRSEAADLRDRAVLLLQAAPDVAGGRSPRTSQALDLEALVRRREVELREARASEDGLRLERDEAQQRLEAFKVEAAVLEQKMRTLRSWQGVHGR